MDIHISSSEKSKNKLIHFNLQSIFITYLAVLAALFLPQEILAADGQDLAAPVLTAVSVAPAVINVNDGSKTVTITISVADDLSGFQRGRFDILRPSGASGGYTYFTINDRISGDVYVGTYEMEIVIPPFSEAGDWAIYSISLQDVTTNYHLYSNDELTTSGLNRVFTVISDTPDLEPPVLESINFSSPEVMPDGSLSVTMTAETSDDVSGFSQGYFFMRNYSSGQQKIFPIYGSSTPVAGDRFYGTYTSTVSLSQYAASGDWVLTPTTNLRDLAGNVGRVNPVDFPSATFYVTPGSEDLEAPVLEAISITKVINTIKGPDTATFTPRFTDDVSGVSYVSASIVSPSGGQIHNLGWGSSSLIVGDANDGTYEFNKLFPQYSEYGEWTIVSMYLKDVAGNPRAYNPAVLKDLDETSEFITTTLKVSGIISDGSGDYIVDSAGGIINTDDGILEVDFPAGAVGDGQEITITGVGEFDPVDIKIGTNVLGEGNVIAEYIFDPDGIIFDEPVTVTMTINVTEFNDNKRERLGVYLNVDTDADGVEDTFELIASTVETIFNLDGTVDMVFVFQLEHFSTYAVIEEIVDDTSTDTVAPTVAVAVPAVNDVLQGEVTLAATVSDDSSIKSASFTIREVNGEDGLMIGYENIPATQGAGIDNWILADFDSSQLLDGYYLIFATAKDAFDNEGTSEAVSFSVRNWSLTDLLPATETNRPGRTMPVKFTMRLDHETDPSMPFVHNEDLMIKIYMIVSSEGDLMLEQTSRFGALSTDYRIDNVKEQYITNFKTSKTASEYLVKIWRTSDGADDFLIDEFTFETEIK